MPDGPFADDFGSMDHSVVEQFMQQSSNTRYLTMPRTSKLTVFLRFIFIGSIPACLMSLLVLFTIGWDEIVVGFFWGWIVTVCVMYFIYWAVANLSVRIVYPEEYRELKKYRIDPFCNSLGPPFNFDSEETRNSTADCFYCGNPMYLEFNVPQQCPACGQWCHRT